MEEKKASGSDDNSSEDASRVKLEETVLTGLCGSIAWAAFLLGLGEAFCLILALFDASERRHLTEALIATPISFLVAGLCFLYYKHKTRYVSLKEASELRVRAEQASAARWEVYRGIGGIVGAIVFVGSWIYCIVTYGYLLGFGLGWLPSLIVAFIAGITWPIILIAIGVIVALIVQ